MHTSGQPKYDVTTVAADEELTDSWNMPTDPSWQTMLTVVDAEGPGSVRVMTTDPNAIVTAPGPPELKVKVWAGVKVFVPPAGTEVTVGPLGCARDQSEQDRASYSRIIDGHVKLHKTPAGPGRLSARLSPSARGQQRQETQCDEEHSSEGSGEEVEVPIWRAI